MALAFIERGAEMIINGMQIDETEILGSTSSRVFTVSDLIGYVLENPGEFQKKSKFIPQKGVWFISAVSGLWYATHTAAGEISKVLIDSRVYIPYNKDDDTNETDCSFCENNRQTGYDYCSYCGNNLSKDK